MKKVLIIEDDINITKVITTFLKIHEYEVMHFAESTSAIEYLSHNDVNVILLDMYLPGVSGLDSIEHIKKYSLAPIIVISAESSIEYKTQAISKGCVDYLVKPIIPEELIVRLDRHINTIYVNEETNLPNKKSLINNYALQSNEALILIEIENISSIQTTCGAEKADEILNQFSRKLEFEIMALDFKVLYRLDKSRFAFLNHIDDLVKDKLDKLYTIMNFFIFDDIKISFNIGVSRPYISNSIEEKINQAMLALRKTKLKNSFIEFFSEDDSSLIDVEKNIQRIIQVIDKALDRNLVIPFVQPIVNSEMEIVKYETLMRITDGEKLLTPYHFMDISKDTKTYKKLSYLMIENVFKYMEKHSYDFSINLSMIDLTDSSFENNFFELLKKYNVIDRLTIEILESESNPDNTKCLETILKLKEKNVKIAIDDFGIGYSNFERLMEFANYITYLKIDGSLIKNICTDKKAYILVKNIVNIAKDLEIKTVAEFVENEEIFNTLKKLGVELFQGYHIGKPKPIDDIKYQNK